mgnify:CR=1 FL=1
MAVVLKTAGSENGSMGSNPLPSSDPSGSKSPALGRSGGGLPEQPEWFRSRLSLGKPALLR